MIEIYTVDAFARELFKGNPAAVCTSFRDVAQSASLDVLFQQIATEMNLSDMAFITRAQQSPSTTRYFLQWFTPAVEVDLCGHATLAIAHIMFERLLEDPSVGELVFETKKMGELKVKRCTDDGRLELDFPIGDPQPVELSDEVVKQLKSGLNIPSTEELLGVQLCKRTKYLLIHLANVTDQIKPQASLADITFDQSIRGFIRGLIVTSASTATKYDFVSRFFAPWVGILEDPVTGSAHTVLPVYWSRILNQEKSIFHAYQSSVRGGEVDCELDFQRGRVFLRGSAITVLQGQLHCPSDLANLVKEQ